jgi:signal transduction histidine kinase
MHRMLGVLRLAHGIEVERAPQPGVRDLETLVEHACEGGIDAKLVVVGGAHELSPGVDLSAFRIVQEALTNVIRHAHARHATVTLSYASGKLDVTIEDDGLGPQPRTAHNGGGPGHGLVGMRERVTLFGGDLRTGAGPGGGGYRVHASLPFS